MVDKSDLVLCVDVGEVSTRALLVELVKSSYRVVGVCDAFTTVDPPHLDVTVGIKSLAKQLGEEANMKIWDAGPEGVKLLCSSGTSGGLHMMVAGVIGMISGESAQRAALGAGAHLLDTFSKDDRRPPYLIIEKMRSEKPDIFLLAGGTDGGASKQVLEMAGLIRDADIKPRYGEDYKLPVIYAGNVDIREDVATSLTEERYATRVVDNVRPLIEKENLGPAKEAIYDSYMEHVIVHSPGYDKLAKWVEKPIIPTQAVIGKALYAYAQRRGVNILAVNVGGSTTDVYSVYDGLFNRTLNADVGLTYGILNVLKKAGIEKILRWMPDEISEREVRNIAANIMALQPEKLQPEEEVVVWAAAREAISLSVEEHKRLASRLKGINIKRTIADTFAQTLESTYLNMAKTRVIIGLGKAFNGLCQNGALALIDALEPVGITELYIDRSGLVPHVGMLLDLNPEAAYNLLSKEALCRLGTIISPHKCAGEPASLEIRLGRQSGQVVEQTVEFGKLKTIELFNGEQANLNVTPSKDLDTGKGKGRQLEATVIGGYLGLIIDMRGRPIKMPGVKSKLRDWLESLNTSTLLERK